MARWRSCGNHDPDCGYDTEASNRRGGESVGNYANGEDVVGFQIASRNGISPIEGDGPQPGELTLTPFPPPWRLTKRLLRSNILIPIPATILRGCRTRNGCRDELKHVNEIEAMMRNYAKYVRDFEDDIDFNGGQ